MQIRKYVFKVILFNHRYTSYGYNCIITTYVGTGYKLPDLKHCFHWLKHNRIRREDWPKPQ
jgi:hypothetical protein